jgi:Meiotically Up-regulated Gene 113 (MUG113) protein
MCYTVTIRLNKDGLPFLVSNCFGFGFDCENQEFIEAVRTKDGRIWQILEWAANGGAERFNKAGTFDEDLSSYNDGGGQLLYFMRRCEKSELLELLENKDLSENARSAIISFMDGSLAEKVRHEKPEPAETKKTKPGYVYLIRAENGLCKIGKAKNVSSRLKPFGVDFPMKWELVHSFHSDDYGVAEKELHYKFRDKRVVGEWFRLLPEDVAHITAIMDGKL